MSAPLASLLRLSSPIQLTILSLTQSHRPPPLSSLCARHHCPLVRCPSRPGRLYRVQGLDGLALLCVSLCFRLATRARTSNSSGSCLRTVLGFFEAAAIPCFSVLTISFWRRSEQPLRVAAWYGGLQHGFLKALRQGHAGSRSSLSHRHQRHGQLDLQPHRLRHCQGPKRHPRHLPDRLPALRSLVFLRRKSHMLLLPPPLSNPSPASNKAVRWSDGPF